MTSALESIRPLETMFGQVPRVKYTTRFGCNVFVPFPPHHRIKIGPRRREGIDVGCKSPNIVKYLDPLTRNLLQ